jgi:hypothetical protein
MNVGDIATVRFQVITDADVPAGAVLTNDAVVWSDELDPDNSNNLAHTENTVLAAADMSVDKTSVGRVVSSWDAVQKRFLYTETANQVTGTRFRCRTTARRTARTSLSRTTCRWAGPPTA